MGEFFKSFLSSWAHLAPIAIAGFVAIAIIVERVMTLFVHYAVDTSAFMQKIHQALLNDDLDTAIKTCDSNPKCILSGIVKAGLMRAATDPEHIKDAIEIAALDVIPKIQKRISYLPMISNVATLLGLLGTISGLISSFKAIASADAATRQTILAEGISVSMNATALGLFVAIPTMIAYSMLSSKANHYLDEIEKASSKIMDILKARIYREFGIGEKNASDVIQLEKGGRRE